MKAIVSYSGGLGSWLTAKLAIERHGPDNVMLVFCDTKSEDSDLYRFVDETVEEMGVEFVRLCDGRDIWEVFHDVKYLGNTRVDPCSKHLKRDLFKKYLKQHYKPDECIIYLGIDWTEIHRLESPKQHYEPYRVEAILCEADNPISDTKGYAKEWLAKLGIQIPRLYEIGYPHNNCGGFCVKAGQAHFLMLLRTNPTRYAYHEMKEQELREYLGKDVAILRDRRGGKTRPMTLKEFRERVMANGEIDLNDWGGCGCFI